MSGLTRQWNGAGPPGSHLEAVEAFVSLADSKLACPELCQVWTSCSAKQRRSQNKAYPVLQAQPAGFRTGSPHTELRHYTVPWTGDETGLLQTWFRLKVFADGVLCWLSICFLNAAHLPGLDTLLSSGTHSRTLYPSTAHGDRNTLVPGTQLPVVQILVPVAHSEAVLLVVWPLCLVAVSV